MNNNINIHLRVLRIVISTPPDVLRGRYVYVYEGTWYTPFLKY